LKGHVDAAGVAGVSWVDMAILCFADDGSEHTRQK
jgi:hypothetical protein